MGWLTNGDIKILFVLTSVTLAVLLAACSPAKDDLFDIGDLATVRAATPTPTPRPDLPSPTPVPTVPPAEMARIAQERSDSYLDNLYLSTEGTVRMGIWDDKRVQLDNHIAGYIIVYGYDYTVEMVETSLDEYQEFLETGELDIVIHTSPDVKEWLDGHAEEGTVLNIGNFVEATPDARIVVHGRLSERAPQIVELLQSMTANDEILDPIAERITGGRFGTNPTVATLIFLKNNEDIWTQWVPEEVTLKVKAAIQSGKTDLQNRKCIPTGGSGSTPNCRGN
jgi:hypothetical protein